MKTIQKTALQFKEVNSTTVPYPRQRRITPILWHFCSRTAEGLAYPEALVLIDRNPDLKEHLKASGSIWKEKVSRNQDAMLLITKVISVK